MRDYLLENPWLYERLFQNNATDCLAFFEEIPGRMPASILDIGCGTGRDLFEISQRCPGCVGIDFLPDLIAYAQKNYPTVAFQVGDMHTLRLGCYFDAILALGASLNYALTNEALDRVMSTYRAHAKPGTLLLLQPLNTCSFMGELNYPSTLEVTHEGKTALARITYEIDKPRQLLTRHRDWELTPCGTKFQDSFQLRMIFPMELCHLLSHHGFEVVAMKEVGAGKAGGGSLYVAAVFRG